LKVEVLFFASLKDISGVSTLSLQCERETTVERLFDHWLENFPEASKYRKKILFAVNDAYASPDYVLNDGDRVAFLPPVSGG